VPDEPRPAWNFLHSVHGAPGMPLMEQSCASPEFRSSAQDRPPSYQGSPALRRPRPLLIIRPAAKNLSFGHGIHFCLGAHLDGREVRAAVGGLLPYFDRLELTGPPLQRNPSALLNGWQRVEMTWAS
jgi:hypothetical protein